jgi:dTDP-glucose 4,6-dehydratase
MAKTIKYLVTGGAGFIGSNFVHYLYRKHKNIQVCVLDKMCYSANIKNLAGIMGRKDFEFIKGDICDPKAVARAMNGANVVVNFAAEVAVDRSIDDPQSFLRTDIFGVYTLLEEARRQKNLQRFIQISTDEVYGQILKGSFREDSQTLPRNPYAASKLGGEKIAYSFFKTYNLPVVVTRAANNYGPFAYPEKVIPLFVTNLFDGLPVPVYGQGKQMRDWLFVEDHCSAVDLLVKKGVSGEVYNVGAGEECTNIALTTAILKLMGKDKSYIRFVADRPGHDFRYSLSCAKMRALGWTPKYGLTKGLKLTVDWYQANESWWRPLKKNLDKRFVGGFWGEKK